MDKPQSEIVGKQPAKKKSKDFSCKIHRRSLFHGLALLPTFFYLIFVLVYFEVSISDQEQINFGLKFGYVPFITVRINYYLILLCHLLMLLGICWNSKFPELAFNASFHTLFLAIASILVIISYKSTLKHFERRVTKFDITNPDERQVTKKQIEFLVSFQKENNCCGISSYMDYDTEIGTYNAPKAHPDKYPDGLVCTFDLSWKQWLEGHPSVDDFMKNKETGMDSSVKIDLENSLELEESCCKEKCDTGCKEALLNNLSKCTSTILLLNLFIMPWIVAVITLMITWSHLRMCQGTTWRNFGGYKIPRKKPNKK